MVNFLLGRLKTTELCHVIKILGKNCVVSSKSGNYLLFRYVDDITILGPPSAPWGPSRFRSDDAENESLLS